LARAHLTGWALAPHVGRGNGDDENQHGWGCSGPGSQDVHRATHPVLDRALRASPGSRDGLPGTGRQPRNPHTRCRMLARPVRWADVVVEETDSDPYAAIDSLRGTPGGPRRLDRAAAHWRAMRLTAGHRRSLTKRPSRTSWAEQTQTRATRDDPQMLGDTDWGGDWLGRPAGS